MYKMLKLITDKTSLKLNEILALFLSFFTLISIFYMFIYKFTLMSFLNISWYSSLLSPQQLIFSSIQNLCLLIFSILITVVIVCFIDNKDIARTVRRSRISIGVVLIITALIALVNKGHNLVDTKYMLPISFIIFNVAYLLQGFMIFKKEQLDEKANVKFSSAYIISGFFILIFVPTIQGIGEALTITKHPDRVLPEVVLKENKGLEKWYLLEARNENILVISKDKVSEENKTQFKIVQIDEIDKVISSR